MTDCLQSSMTGSDWPQKHVNVHTSFSQSSLLSRQLQQCFIMRVTQNDLPKQNGCLKLSEMIVTKMIMFLTLALHDLDLQATRGKILPDKFEQYLMRNPCRWPLSHILGSTQIESSLDLKLADHIYIYLDAYLFTGTIHIHVYIMCDWRSNQLSSSTKTQNASPTGKCRSFPQDTKSSQTVSE